MIFMTTAVIYASKFGKTKMAAEYIAQKIGAEAIDVKNCKDISRACFLPFDPDVYINPELLPSHE